MNAKKGSLPDGWFDWEQDMRNLNIHRGRQVHTLLQRIKDAEQPQMIVYDRDPDDLSRTNARFDLYLRSRPGLPDMQDLVTTEDQHVWLPEPAAVTLSVILNLLNDLIEEASQILLRYWRYAAKWGAFFVPPVEKWALEKPEPRPFKGILEDSTDYPAGQAIVGPHLAERLRLAQKLREGRAP